MGDGSHLQPQLLVVGGLGTDEWCAEKQRATQKRPARCLQMLAALMDSDSGSRTS